MAAPKKPQDLHVVNGWYLEIPGLISPHFETLEGIKKTTNNVEIVDAGTNRKHRFGSQIIDYGEMTLTRTRQGKGSDDKVLFEMINAMIEAGVTVPCTAVKKHNGKVVSMIVFDDFHIFSRSLPTLDVNGEEKFIESYGATCSSWDEVFI